MADKVRDDIDSSTDAPERREIDRSDDDQEHVEVQEKDGKTEVQFAGESKRERRLREIREERQKEINDAVNPLRDSLASTQKMLQDALSRLQAPQAQQQRPQAEPSTDVDDLYAEVAEKQERLLAVIRAGGFTAEQGAKYKREYYKLDRERAQIASRPIAAEAISKFRPVQGPSAYEQQLATDHPDVWYNEDAKAYALNLAMAKQGELKAQGKPVTPGEIKRIHNESLTRAGEVFGFRQPASAPASEGQRQRFAGTSAAAKGSGKGRTRSMSEQEKGLATGMFPNLPENEAIAKWAKMADEAGI